MLGSRGAARRYLEIEILTTCARDHRTWANVYPSGTEYVRGVRVRRFPVTQRRDPAAFDRLSRQLAGRASSASPEEQRRWGEAQGPVVPGLRAHLLSEGTSFDVVWFFSYLYATTFATLGSVAEKSILAPLAHDEWMLGFPFYETLFRSAAQVVFVDENERRIVERRFPGLPNLGPTIGFGIEPSRAEPNRFRETTGIFEPFILYVGRVEAAKNVDVLIEDFLALRARETRPRKLVLVGPVALDVPAHPDIVALGPLDEENKWDALAASEAVVVPSAFESLSLAALEALAVGVPIVVNGASSVLVGHARSANAGLWYASRAEFIEIFRSDFFGAREALARRGPRYVAERYSWPAAIEACAAIGESVVARVRA